MFCPSNETLQSLSEKTKLLAQKCTQQIRVTAQHQCTPLIKKDGTQTKDIKISSGLRCFCPCKNSFKINKKSPTKVGTTRWYVKVIQLK